MKYPNWKTFFCLFVLLQYIACKPTPQLSTIEFNSLYDLYNVTDGKHWIWFNLTGSVPWNFSVPNANPCSDNWEGLVCQCDVKDCQVIVIELNEHGLNGTMPESIGNFSALMMLELRANNLTNSIPSNIGYLTELVIMDLAFNDLKGEIPSSIGNLVNLEILNLDVNRLTRIPEELYHCNNLQVLSITQNLIGGRLSNSIGNLTNMQHLNLLKNFINSTLPASIGNLALLETMDITNNFFHSSIPKTVGKLKKLIDFNSGSNFFSGLIPSELGNMTNLGMIFLTSNRLFGPVPESVGYLPHLAQLGFNSNYLSGTLPDSYRNFTHLFSFFIEKNSFHGNISVIGSMNNLSLLQVNQNFFSGPVADGLEALRYVAFIDLGTNSFSKQLPYSPDWKLLITIETNQNYFTGGLTGDMENLARLSYYVAAYNYLSGSLNENIFRNCSNLDYIDLSVNYFSGSLPKAISYLPSLNQLYLFQNFFSGSIPQEIGNLKKLVVLSMYSNGFTGTIPLNSISNLNDLEEIFLQDNTLSGPIQNLFNLASQKSLVSIDASNNQFTGTIPTSFLSTSMITALVLSSNCFTGSIPEELCNVKSLTSLSLDGLATASNCRISLFSALTSVFNSFFLKHYIQGNIPSCLLKLPSLQLLHLSGNGLTGTIPSNLQLNPALNDLSFSHNILSGTIPSTFQNRSWSSLDLSYNKLSGTLEASLGDFYGLTTTLSLDVNRLSGDIPFGLLSAGNISILNGNIFYCGFFGNNLPINDPEYNTYSCGSDNVNYVLYAWLLVLFGLLPVVIIIIWRFVNLHYEGEEEQKSYNTIIKLLSLWKNELQKPLQFRLEDVRSLVISTSNRSTLVTKSNEIRNNIQRLSVFFFQTRTAFIVLMLYCIVILLPLDSILKINYSSYTVEYAWTVSGMLLRGEGAAILLFLSLFIFIVLTQYLFKRMIHIIKKASYQKEEEKTEETVECSSLPSHNSSRKDSPDEERKSVISENGFHIFMIYCCVFLINLVIMGIVDFSYVYIVITYDAVVISFAAIALAIFRLVTNNTLLWHSIPSLLDLFMRMNCIQLSTFTIKSSKNESNAINANSNSSKSNRLTIAQERPALESIYDIIYHYSPGDISFLENIVLFNNVVIPCLAIIFILPDCFYNALFAPGNVDTTYSYESCTEYYLNDTRTHDCTPQLQTIAYSPPYIYSYQCSSKIIINYVPVYVLMFLIVGVVLPLSQIVLKIIYDYSILRFNKFRSTKNVSSAKNEERPPRFMPSSLGFRIVSMLLPEKLKFLSPGTVSLQQYTLQQYAVSGYGFKKNNIDANTNQSSLRPSSDRSLPQSSLSSLPSSETNNQLLASNQIIFSKTKLTIQINSYLAIMISFGALFPPLAFLACLTIIIVTLYEEIVLGQILTKIRTNKLIYYEMKINQECYHIEEGINLTLWSTLFVSCCLYSYILFDTMGDENGWEAALPMTIIMFCLPFLLYLVNFLVDKFHLTDLLFSFACCVFGSTAHSAEKSSADSENKISTSSDANDIIPGEEETLEKERNRTSSSAFYRQSRTISDIQMVSRDSTVVMNKLSQQGNVFPPSSASPSVDMSSSYQSKSYIKNNSSQFITENPMFSNRK
jgi:Leucine-rich repeat (LRR) protein